MGRGVAVVLEAPKLDLVVTVKALCVCVLLEDKTVVGGTDADNVVECFPVDETFGSVDVKVVHCGV